MPITDLTGTKWIFNAEISTPSSNENYSIDFSNGVNDYNLFSIGKQDGKTAAWFASSLVFYGASWVDESYRIIEITSGTDVDNSSLISWLQSNAVQVEVTSLASTEWLLNEPFEWIGDSINASLYFTSNTENYAELDYNTGTERLRYYSEHAGPYVNVLSGGATTFQTQAYRTISIVSGSDATNPDVIAWFTNNASNQTPTPTPATGSYSFEQNLNKLAYDDITLNITPASGYKLPDTNNIDVEDGTIISVDRRSGAPSTIKVSSSTTAVTCGCVSSTGVAVTITYTGDRTITVLTGASADAIENPILVNASSGQHDLILNLDTDSYIKFTTDDDYFNSIEYDHDYAESLGDNAYRITAGCSFTIISGSVCVIGETKIAMDDGSYKEIKDIKRGDYIKAINPYADNAICTGIITNFKVGYTKSLVLMLLSNGTELRMTRTHPVLTTDGYKTYRGYGTKESKLEEGDEIITNDGIVYIDRLEEYTTPKYTAVYALGALLIDVEKEINNDLNDASNTIWVPYIANDTVSIPVAKKGMLRSSGAKSHGGSDGGGSTGDGNSTGGLDYGGGMHAHSG